MDEITFELSRNLGKVEWEFNPFRIMKLRTGKYLVRDIICDETDSKFHETQQLLSLIFAPSTCLSNVHFLYFLFI